MKYLITEIKMSKLIHEYLDDMFPKDQIVLRHPLEYNENGEEDEDKCRIKFSMDNDVVFYYYKRCYWTDVNISNSRLSELYNPPYLDIEAPLGDILRGTFGNYLDEAFKKWFINRYNLPLNKIG